MPETTSDLRELLEDLDRWFDGWCPTHQCCADSGKELAERISAFLRSSVERQPQVARLVPQWSLQAASARQRGNKIEAVTLDFCCDDLEKALAPVSVAHQPEEPVTSRAMKDAQR